MKTRWSHLGVKLLTLSLSTVLLLLPVRAQQQATAAVEGGARVPKTPASPVRPGPGQTDKADQLTTSAWADKFTGGHHQHAELVENDPNAQTPRGREPVRFRRSED